MIEVNLLKAEIVKNGMTQGELCKIIGMSRSTFVRKMKMRTMGTDEAEKIIKALNIDDPAKIFLGTD